MWRKVARSGHSSSGEVYGVLLNIVHVFADGFSELNSSVWRGIVPCRALIKANHNVYFPHVDQWFSQSPEVRYHCSLADIIIVQRVLVEQTVDHVRYWRGQKKALVVDADDHYQLLRPADGNQASTFWYEGKVEVKHPLGISYYKNLDKHPLQQYYEGGRICSGFTFPSKILIEDCRHITPCWYIPNFIYSPVYLSAKAKRTLPNKDNELVIGWGGSMSHLNSFKNSGVAEALRRVFLKRKHIKFMLCGDPRVRPLLPLSPDKVIYQQYVTWEDWPRVISQFDITIAPLAGRYDDGRSSIKCLEASIMGIPIISSGSPAYDEWRKNGVGMYTKDSSDDPKTKPEREAEWEKCLIDIIDNYEYHKVQMERKFEYAMTWDMDANVPYLIKTYEDIISRG